MFFRILFCPWYPVPCLSKRERKASDRAGVRNSQPALKLCCRYRACQHLFHTTALCGFLFWALAWVSTCLFLELRRTRSQLKLEASKNSHTSIWPGFHIVRNARSGHLVFAHFSLKWLLASFSWAKIWL